MSQIVSLKKNQKVSLNKNGKRLTRITLGLGWKEAAYASDDFDLDSCALIVSNGRVLNVAEDFIFPAIKETNANGSVKHMGDNTSGGDGINDDENISIDLEKLPSKYDEVIILIAVYEAKNRNQNFGMIDSAFARVINDETNEEVVRIDLTDVASVDTCLEFCSIKRTNDGWELSNTSKGYTDGLAEFFKQYNIEVEA